MGRLIAFKGSKTAFALSVSALLLIPAFARADGPSSLSAMNSLVQARVGHELFSSAAVGAVLPDSPTDVVSTYGAATADSLFELGSITKSFTGILFAELVDEGKISPDDDVGQYVPSLSGSFAGSITLAELATHTSGLASVPDDLPDTLDPYATYTWPMLEKSLQSAKPPENQGKPYPASYSNMGFALLGHVLSLIDGKSFADMIRDRITGPLGMTSTVTKVPAASAPLFIDGHGVDLATVRHWNWDAFEPAGCLRSSVEDMLKYVHANLHPDTTPLGRAIALSQSKNWGWDSALAGLKFPYKNGGTGGFRTALFVDPDKNVGAIVLTDIAYEADTLALSLLDPKIQDETDFGIPSATLASFVGNYLAADRASQDEIDVLLPSRFLIADFSKFTGLPNEGRVRLMATSATTFETIDNFGTLLELRGTMTFQSDASGRVVGFRLQVTLPDGSSQSMDFVTARSVKPLP